MIRREQAAREFERLSEFRGHAQLAAAAVEDYIDVLANAATCEIAHQVIADFLNEVNRDWIPFSREIKTALEREADRRNPALYRSHFKLHPDCPKCDDTGWVPRKRMVRIWPGSEPVEYSGVTKCDCKHAPPDRRDDLDEPKRRKKQNA